MAAAMQGDNDNDDANAMQCSSGGGKLAMLGCSKARRRCI